MVGKPDFTPNEPPHVALHVTGRVLTGLMGLSVEAAAVRVLEYSPWLSDWYSTVFGAPLTDKIIFQKIRPSRERLNGMRNHLSQRRYIGLVNEIIAAGDVVSYEEWERRMAQQPEVAVRQKIYVIRVWRNPEHTGSYYCRFGITNDTPDWHPHLKYELGQREPPLYPDAGDKYPDAGDNAYSRLIGTDAMLAAKMKSSILVAVSQTVPPIFGGSTFAIDWILAKGALDRVLKEELIEA